MKTYKVGRSRSKSDIVLPGISTKVSGVHIELVDTEDGQYYINDLSANGTSILKDNHWVRKKQTYVDIRTPIKLADYQTTVGNILASRPQETAPEMVIEKSDKAYKGKIQRNPETGEIIES